MKIAGEATLQAPVKAVWDALLDPSVLVRTIPGCERLETTGENAYDMTVTVGVAAIKGTYAGSCRLSDLVPHESLVLSAQGAGAPGTIGADVKVRFEDNGDGTTTLRYDADAVVGGMIGGVGQRMLTSVSRRMAAEFFGAVEKVLTGEPAVAAAAESAAEPVAAPESGAPAAQPAAAAPATPVAQPGVFTAPPKQPSAAAAPSPWAFLSGVAVGGGLVALGVVLGAVVGRRR
jgi:carbon monoxide dehydrogenase subunit G